MNDQQVKRPLTCDMHVTTSDQFSCDICLKKLAYREPYGIPNYNRHVVWCTDCMNKEFINRSEGGRKLVLGRSEKRLLSLLQKGATITLDGDSYVLCERNELSLNILNPLIVNPLIVCGYLVKDLPSKTVTITEKGVQALLDNAGVIG